MASIHRHPNSKYWYCTISLGRSRQLQRSTKQTNKRLAYDFAVRMENAACGRTLTADAARKILSDIYAIHNPGQRLPGSTAREFFDAWLANKVRETAPATGDRYAGAINAFVESLGDRGGLDVSAITRTDIVKFRDKLAARLSAASANDSVKIVRMALKDAVTDSLVTSNAAVGVRRVAGDGNRRRPFTLPEIKKLLCVASDEWRGIILFGLYTGQRLGDIARLTWQNVDLTRGELGLFSQKTKRPIQVPLAAPLQKFLMGLTAGDDPKQPLFRRAAAVKRTGALSNQFHAIMAAAGLVVPRSHQSTGKGRNGRRTFGEISFHSFRHTATSLMKNAGVSPAVVQDIIGHDSPAVSAHYTVIEDSTKRRAVDLLPDVT